MYYLEKKSIDFTFFIWVFLFLFIILLFYFFIELFFLRIFFQANTGNDHRAILMK